MQLARNLFPERIPGRARTLQRKLLEIRVAREIEQAYTKDEILELYLNHIFFGEGRAASRRRAQSTSAVARDSSRCRGGVARGAAQGARPLQPARGTREAARERRDLVLR